MEKYDFMTAADVAKYLGIGRSKAYEIVRRINAELALEGFIVIPGKIPRSRLMAKFPPQ